MEPSCPKILLLGLVLIVKMLRTACLLNVLDRVFEEGLTSAIFDEHFHWGWGGQKCSLGCR